MSSLFRPLRLLSLLAVVLLLTTGYAVWAGWVASDHLPHWARMEGGSSPGTSPEVEAPAPEVKMVVCIGYADTEFGVTSLFPSQAGRVTEIVAYDNETVSAGEPLLKLDDQQAKYRLEEAQAALETARIQLTQAEKSPQQHQAQVTQQQATVQSFHHQVAAARHTLLSKRHQQAIQDVGRERPDPVMAEEVIAAEEKVKELEGAEQAERAKLDDLQTRDPSLEIQKARADVATMAARLKEAQRSLEECTLRAPRTGTVLRVLVSPGEMLMGQGGKAAVDFRPRGPCIVRCEVDQEFAGRLAVGLPALIEDDVMTAGTTWQGRVQRVADWYSQGRFVMDEKLQRQDVRTLECIIALDPDQPPLRIGQRLRVTIHREDP